MTYVSKEQFEAFVAANAVGEPVTERDTEYSYENYLNADGEEIAFAVYHAHKPDSFIIRDGVEHEKSS